MRYADQGGSFVKIIKRINNNVVLSKEDEVEVILMGKGIGFQTKPGDLIPAERIEKKYYPEDDLTVEHMSKVMTKADEKQMAVIYEIVRLFRESVGTDFNPNVYFTLMDHILFAISRQKQEIVLTNPMHWEIKKIYAKEYAVSVQAVELIRKELYPDFSQEEAAFITLHFVNAQIEKSANQSAYEHTELTNNILRIVKYSMNIEYDENSSYFQRFVTHIRYYLIRQSQEKEEPVLANPMIALAFSSYPKEKETADSIKEYLFEQKGWHVNDMELMYLILHIGNLAAHSKLT
ncbi:PRD domain protein [Enterococcus faecalis 06-MB-DW-09]|jgi:beta-glucoside operon transcriptional antiterminator|nr:PRD domain protein [Enterococcus faecium 13.SD.W.09]EPH93529.1 PRD domain protein [Enterococcus faecalis 06-MB-DW-09]